MTMNTPIAEKTSSWERLDGLLSLFLDPATGRLWLLLPPPQDRTGLVGEFLYAESIACGLGQVSVGLDRGEMGCTYVVALRRVGDRMLVEARNTRFRTQLEDEAAQRAVRESFAPSILWAGPVETVDIDGTALVDITPLIVRDAHEATARLAEHGEYKLDAGRSVLDVANCLAFPENLELQAVLTFASEKPGEKVKGIPPADRSITIVQHHSLVRLPDDGYRPRRFDPRSGSYAVPFTDLSAPLDEPLEVQYAERHRLQKEHPGAAPSRPVEPIVYYLDPAAPEPVRSALLEGIGWWREAFEAAAFVDGFRVELMPEGMHPLDARFNTVQWIHRTTRGSSFGRTITDPRTGEIVKGHVILDSQRIRQVRLLFEGLAGADATGTGAPDDPIQLALARIRQLGAHEVGHTLGFAHNFAASTYMGRASVMDYPAPLVGITENGELDFSQAYAKGIGAWDIVAARYAYTEFAPGTDETAALADILAGAERDGHIFLADQDARGAEAAHPLASLWDNGADPVESLRHTLHVRKIALDRFGEQCVKRGAPLARLEEVLAPVYFHHRYQVTAALKVLGGIEYATPHRDNTRNGAAAVRMVDGTRQWEALDALLACLDPETLDIPERVLTLLAPRPYESERSPEMFPSGTGPAFDALGAARSAADMVVTGLLNPARCARLVDFHRRDLSLPGLEDVLGALIRAAFPAPGGTDERHAEICRAVQEVTVSGLINLAANASAPLAVTGRAEAALIDLRDRLRETPGADAAQRAMNGAFAALIDRHLARPFESAPQPQAPPSPPPGAPIGSDGW